MLYLTVFKSASKGSYCVKSISLDLHIKLCSIRIIFTAYCVLQLYDIMMMRSIYGPT